MDEKESISKNSQIQFQTSNDSCFFHLSSLGHPKTDLFIDQQLSCTRKGCPRGQYQCYLDAYCIDIELICDGIVHCLQGDDETNCGNIINLI